MCYTFARVSAMVHMRVEDYDQSGQEWWVRLHEKGGKRHEAPAHHNAEAVSGPIWHSRREDRAAVSERGQTPQPDAETNVAG